MKNEEYCYRFQVSIYAYFILSIRDLVFRLLKSEAYNWSWTFILTLSHVLLYKRCVPFCNKSIVFIRFILSFQNIFIMHLFFISRRGWRVVRWKKWFQRRFSGQLQNFTVDTCLNNEWTFFELKNNSITVFQSLELIVGSRNSLQNPLLIPMAAVLCE